MASSRQHLQPRDLMGPLTRAAHAGNGNVALGPALRSKLLAALERAAVDREYLTDYLRSLVAAGVPAVQSPPPQADGLLRAAREGLDGLDDQQLAALAVSPAHLLFLHHALLDELVRAFAADHGPGDSELDLDREPEPAHGFPPWWWDAFGRVARQQVEEGRICTPTIEELTCGSRKA